MTTVPVVIIVRPGQPPALLSLYFHQGAAGKIGRLPRDEVGMVAEPPEGVTTTLGTPTL